jgi:hypothetical protein
VGYRGDQGAARGSEKCGHEPPKDLPTLVRMGYVEVVNGELVITLTGMDEKEIGDRLADLRDCRASRHRTVAAPARCFNREQWWSGGGDWVHPGLTQGARSSLSENNSRAVGDQILEVGGEAADESGERRPDDQGHAK